MNAILSVLFLMIPHAPAAEPCRVVKVNAPAMMGRGSSVKFPNGRTITIIDHVHGPRDAQVKMMDNLLNPDLKDARVEALNTPSRELHSIAVTQLSADLKYLNTQTRAPGRPLTLWAEGSDQEVNQRVADVRRVSAMRRIRGKLATDLLVAAGSPVIFLKGTTTLPATVALRGAERITPAITASWAESKALRAGIPSLNQLGEADPAASRLVWDTRREIDAIYKGGRGQQLSTFDLANVDAKVAALDVANELKDPVKRHVRAYLNDVRTLFERDVSNVNELLQDDRDGIFLVGDYHAAATLQLLKARCEEISARPAAPVGEPVPAAK